MILSGKFHNLYPAYKPNELWDVCSLLTVQWNFPWQYKNWPRHVTSMFQFYYTLACITSQ